LATEAEAEAAVRDLGRALWVMAVLAYLLAAACLTGVLAQVRP
jgi:hypothetical protein